MKKQLGVPVGATPHSIYATWDEHRAALRKEADERRARMLSARAGATGAEPAAVSIE